MYISAQVEQTLKHDRYLSPHYRYYAREMRILAYKQLLESYSSLTLDYMSKAFGVSVGFIDQWAIVCIATIHVHITNYTSNKHAVVGCNCAAIWRTQPNIMLFDIKLVPAPGELNKTCVSSLILAHWLHCVKT